MLKLGFDAYIIPNDDEHQSEYVSPTDERRSYISGFSGSAGTAVVTMDQQALWTDGRYFLQADQQLDCHWLLMKQKNPGVPKMMEWLRQKLVKGSKVGKKWEDKVADVRAEMLKEGADLLVVTALDEVAWLLNLRGNDIPYNPGESCLLSVCVCAFLCVCMCVCVCVHIYIRCVFLSVYVYFFSNQPRPFFFFLVFRSYLILGRDDLQLYIPKEKITPAVDHHLHVNSCEGQECVVINEYTAVLDRLRALKLNNHVKKVMLGSKYSYSGGASYAVYSAVPEEMRLMVTSPVLLMKARKNAVEVDGMKNAHIKDAVALCDFLSFMEPEIMEGKNWSEIDAANLLKEYRSQQRDFKGISFTTISAFGSNGAIVHYQPVRETDKKITNTSLYLLDSGGQYKDGTTDVTRTMHYGDPKPLHVEAYTRVLMGAIDLATLIFPEGTGDADVDIMARRSITFSPFSPLVCSPGNQAVAPIQVRIYATEEHKFEVGHFFSDEPGFYLDNDFGVRLETIVTVVPKDTPYHFDKRSLGFEAVTLVPFEPKLINITMLTGKQCHWLNSYHARVRDVVGGELMTQGRTRGYEWLISKTEPLPCVNHYGGTLGKSSDTMAALTVSDLGSVIISGESAGLMSSTNLQHVERVAREAALDGRTNCKEGNPQPEIRVNTSSQMTKLRQEMGNHRLDGYIIPMTGEQHGYLAPAEKRLQYMTGFTGSFGNVAVTADEQALWTDGRYFLQADSELGCDWLLMKEQIDGVPTISEWLRSKLVSGAKVGADPRLIAADTWKFYSEELASKRWEDKVADVRAEMERQGADILVITAPDEVAWLLNLRGSDVETTPEVKFQQMHDTVSDALCSLAVFRSYVIIGRNNVELFVPPDKITPAVDNHLNVNQCGEQECVIITEYIAILDRLRVLKLNNGITKVMLGKKYSYSGGASYAIYSAVPEEKRLVTISPVLEMKARKNPVEIKGMKDSHIRDAVALCDFLSFMEKEINSGNSWNEITASEKLLELRRQQQNFMGVSFKTISAFGPNGAVIHYRPRPDTNREITTESLYLLDSGGQYKDGTTDVTRTMHYGEPTSFQVEAYTRVLIGAIDLARLIFPEGTDDTDIDILARRPLYEVGLDYRHGTGHGIGHFLGVHEGEDTT
ncbi:Xaa-Pro aminopeptidase 1-like 1 [Homarus americanus]|uniref:Xaa-Pro aminopeptidase 1-like 1 n=1 Tax=Homarus americanus TaxID=6706 RepID=A0A8J5JI45_HOMAM|nr:Xaa-Pro aminopeptidase 1-like 1 [Homarus americanus]